MIMRDRSLLSADDLEESLASARSLLDHRWLEAQHSLQPSDPLLAHLKTTLTKPGLIHGIRYGVTEGMHPLAEAVFVGQAVWDQYKKTGNLCGSTLLYLLASLRDLLKAKTRINNIDNRIPRLQGVNWKSTLYELLVAASYTEQDSVVGLLPESTSHTPDLELMFGQKLFAECKAKLKYESEIMAFVEDWRRNALWRIAEHLSKVDAGFLVKVRMNDDTAIPHIPLAIEEMVAAGEYSRVLPAAQIHIEPFESTEISLPNPTPWLSVEFWEWAMGFKEWKEWHYVLPGGHCKFVNLSNLVVEKIKRPVLICVRADHLVDNTQKVYSALDHACSKQFKRHKPGIIHVLINTDLFGLGPTGEPAYIKQILTNETLRLFQNYSRVWKVLYDIVTPPPWGKYAARANRLILTNERCTIAPRSYEEPPAILLW